MIFIITSFLEELEKTKYLFMLHFYHIVGFRAFCIFRRKYTYGNISQKS